MFSCPYEEQCDEYLEEHELEANCQLGSECGYFDIFYINQMKNFMESQTFQSLMTSIDKKNQENNAVVTKLLEKTRKKK